MDLPELQKKLTVFVESVSEEFRNLENSVKALQEQKKKLEEETKNLEKIRQHWSGRIKLDVGGSIFSTSQSTLTKYPESMLGKMFSGRFSITKEEDGSVFIDRDGTYFSEILNFLRDSEITPFPTGDKLQKLLKEAVYYQLDPLVDYLSKVGVGDTSNLSKVDFGSTSHLRLILKSVSDPVDVGLVVDQTQGRMLIDLISNNRYIFHGYRDAKIIPLNQTEKLTIPNNPSIGIAVLNKHFYFAEYSNNCKLFKFNAEQNQIVTHRTHDQISNGGNYAWGGNSATVFHVDELGLWLTYKNKSGGFGIDKIDPNTLETTQNWTTKPVANGGSFMICGILYFVKDYSTGSLSECFNTHTGVLTQINISFCCRGYHSSSTYVPSERALYCVDNGKILKYNLSLE